MVKMKILFLDFDGVITSLESGWRINVEKLKLVNKIIDKTNAKIVVTSSWKHGFENANEFIENITGKYNTYQMDENNPFDKFINEIYDITDSKGSWRGDEIERWLNEHEENVENYVILDDDSDFHEDQLFNFVQTDTFEGLTEREVKLCVAILNGKRVNNPIRMNLELTTMWRNKCHGIQENNIEQLLNNYYNSIQ